MKKLHVKTVQGKIVDMPELPKEPPPIPKWKTWDELSELAKDPFVWNHPRLVYVASADQWLGMKAFFDKDHLMECDVFYSVIGGLGGLNFLHMIKQARKIVFYDSNSYAVRILDLQIQLIINCSSVNEYISHIYQREFDMLKYNVSIQLNFLNSSVDGRYKENLNRILTPKALETYNYYYQPYVDASSARLHGGPTIHCSWLLPLFERDPTQLKEPNALISDSLVMPLFDTGPMGGNNFNTFYVGKGWLESDEAFLATQHQLLNLEVEALIGDITHLSPEGDFPGIYLSNIFSTDPKFRGYEKVVSLFNWAIGYDDYTNWEVQYYPNELEGMVDYESLAGAGNTNTHETCCGVINNLLNLNTHSFLEIISPPSGETKWGFRFYKGQNPVLVDQYLNLQCSENIIVLHILLGAGVPLEAWKAVCGKAVCESKRHVLVFEHRKECTDWPEDDVHSENLISHKELDQFLYSLDFRWRKFGIANSKGDSTDVRNILYFLDKEVR
jgi:hypothetical protein